METAFRRTIEMRAQSPGEARQIQRYGHGEEWPEYSLPWMVVSAFHEDEF
jgi:hypothetical protein